MNQLETITTLTKRMGISTRTLRYYEQLGLIESKRTEGYAYRVYDKEACQRLEQILILRALRIPLKQIALLVRYPDTASALEIFAHQVAVMEEEIDSLSAIRDIIRELMDELCGKTHLRLNPALLEDKRLVKTISALRQTCAKEKNNMEKVENANKRLNKLTDRDVRIIYLPPARVAAYRYVGDDPEGHVNAVIDAFVREHDLIHQKPDMRHYGFNAPNPVDATGFHGYEMWITIPEDMEVPPPLENKRFEGGLYAAVTIPFGAFEVWQYLIDWVRENDRYEYRGDWNGDNMFGCIEEHLNYFNHVMLENTEPEETQLDLLIPIRERKIV